MPRRIVAFTLLAVVLAAVFVRLGIWQLDRLQQRRAHNAQTLASLREPPVPITELRGAAGVMRRAVVEGTPDWEHEFVLSGRSMNGSPGVWIITPVRTDSAHAVLVNRGWVYSPDARTADLTKWREPRTRYTGYTSALTSAGPPVGAATRGRSVRSLSVGAIRTMVPYATSQLYLVVRDSGGAATPARLPEPELDDGPHLSYAIQWFSFASIALVGAGIVVTRARRAPRDGSTAA